MSKLLKFFIREMDLTVVSKHRVTVEIRKQRIYVKQLEVRFKITYFAQG
jgi:hypothetical protein